MVNDTRSDDDGPKQFGTPKPSCISVNRSVPAPLVRCYLGFSVSLYTVEPTHKRCTDRETNTQ
ncbi:hypothetical protein CHS0354_043109, partial [Potamilus streckersoni]